MSQPDPLKGIGVGQEKMSVHERLARGYPAEPEPSEIVRRRARNRYATSSSGRARIVAWGNEKATLGGREYTRKYVAVRKSILKRRFGLTLGTYEALLVKQNGVCAVCERLPEGRQLDIDHDHVTGVVRGLLCGSCNRALGQLKEDVVVVEALAGYLRAYKASQFK